MLGGDVQVEGDTVTIHPSPLHGGIINPKGDHRTAMAFAVVGLGAGGVTIRDAECVSKSYPQFWHHLAGAGLLGMGRAPGIGRGLLRGSGRRLL